MMQIGFVIQSYLADYNFGCAHFLRGLIRELLNLGHWVKIFCPQNSWVAQKARELGGDAVVAETLVAYPVIETTYFSGFAEIERGLDHLDAVLVNEWIDDAVAYQIAERGGANRKPVTLYYDTHHRIVTATQDLRHAGVDSYAAILVLAHSVKAAYERRRLAERVIVFAEAVDDRLFVPVATRRPNSAIWIGNFGNRERGERWIDALTEPASRHAIATSCYGVGYSSEIIDRLRAASVFVGGWLPNVRVPRIAAPFGWMLHFPREPYTDELAGVPNIRPFEAAALGVPLVVVSPKPIGSPFAPEEHYLLFESVDAYLRAVSELLVQQERLAQMAQRARVLAGHRCRDRAEQLIQIVRELS